MFAPGLLDKTNKPELPRITSPVIWEFVIQQHNANRAGVHYDVRLGDPTTGQGHSWAGKYLPMNGEKTLMTQQGVHTIPYFDFAGDIKSGYGAGTVQIVYRGKAEIIHSEPGKITFYLYKTPSTPEKYTLVRTGGDSWVFLNHTFNKETKKILENIPKLTYKPTDISDLNKMEFVTPKIDGASAITIFRPNKAPLVYGKRESKRTGFPVEYTAKIPGLLASKHDLGTTILRTEVFSYTPDNKELPNRILSGLLNSNVLKSREDQKALSAPLRLAAFDVLKYKGRNVENLPIDEKYRIINEISKTYPSIYNPINLEKQVKFNEGFIGWKAGKPHKMKFLNDWDVYVKDVFPSTKKDFAGGILYSNTPDGPIVGAVGTGWNHAELKDMLKNKDKYIGRVAKITALEQHPSGALRAPSYKSWHLDKGIVND